MLTTPRKPGFSFSPCAAALLWIVPELAPAQFPATSLHVSEPPRFAVTEKGFRHSLRPLYSTFADWVDPHSAVGRTYHCHLESGPSGMSLTPEGSMEWTPDASAIGNSVPAQVVIRVLKDGQQIHQSTRGFNFDVLADLPQLAEIVPRVGYERNPIGWSAMIFEGFQPSDEDRKKFRWSLINPPPGVYIDSQGGLHWPDDQGYAREEPYTFTIRIDYESANGWLSDEQIYRHRVLPKPATNNYGELRSYNLQPQAGGMLGYSLAAGDGWIAAGEPFPDYSSPGRVRLWRWNESNGTYHDSIAFQPDVVVAGQQFGASVSLSERSPGTPLRIAVGAPAASRLGNSGENITSVGSVHAYTCNPDGTWQREATLSPPLVHQSLEFGRSVSTENDTLIAGMPGMNTAGYDTGAVAVFHRDNSGWSHSQTLSSITPAWGDRFGEAIDLEGEWIAAAAPGDDDEGDSAGVVHLYKKSTAGYVHQQVIHSPRAENGSRFGEHVLMAGPWLFVGSFREREATGAVHVFKESSGTWTYRQSLVSPFAGEGSAFGVSLSHSDGVLAVSAPGYVFGDSDIDGSEYPWKGITLFTFVGETWKWTRQVTESPDGSYHPHTWGYALCQIGVDMTVAGIPDHSPSVEGQVKQLGGRLFLHRWPTLLTDPFESLLASLPPVEGRPARPDDDSNQNGVPNLLDWMMGSHPGTGPDWWTAKLPESKQPFIRRDSSSGDTIFMIPEIQGGLNRRIDVEFSDDLLQWTKVQNARWGPLEETYFKRPDGNYLTYFHPVAIPVDHPSPSGKRFFRWSVDTVSAAP